MTKYNSSVEKKLWVDDDDDDESSNSIRRVIEEPHLFDFFR